MRILILNWRDIKNPKSGGAEVVTMAHAKAWAKKGNDVTWFTSSFLGGLKKETIDGVKIVRQGNAFTVYLRAPLFYLFSNTKFDLVIDEIHGLPFFTPLYVRKPKVVLIHEVAKEIWDYMYPFPVNVIGRFLETFYFKFYKNVLFWTDAASTIDDLEALGIPRKNCVDIPCPVMNKTLEKLPEKQKTPTFIFVSRIVKMKGIEEVIKAFALILQKEKNAKLWIVGDGERKYKQYLKNLVKELGCEDNIQFLGYVSDQDKLGYMGKSHIILHASVREGWGLSTLEAASQATPSVAYDAPGLRDSIKNGKTGILVKERTPENLAVASLGLLRDNKKYLLFQKACLEWTKSLSWEKVTQTSLHLLEQAL